ncbi:MAG TPA: YfiR family protein [Verrucomicrobiae bacterium]|nr:YfiR family protein [Verrucomicrobiae bacterium]
MAAVAAIVAATVIMMSPNHAAGAPALSEYQVKALFLFNFAKYVDWPSNAFGDGSAPIVIGLVGDDEFGDDVMRAVGGKSVNNRPVVFKRVTSEQEYRTCHILFVSASEKDHLAAILAAVKDTSVLTVGETDGFLTLNGMINLAKKDNKIRLEINLVPTQQANLKLSSKLLSVADVVLGKPERPSAAAEQSHDSERKAK